MFSLACLGMLVPRTPTFRNSTMMETKGAETFCQTVQLDVLSSHCAGVAEQTNEMQSDSLLAGRHVCMHDVFAIL